MRLIVAYLMLIVISIAIILGMVAFITLMAVIFGPVGLGIALIILLVPWDD